MFRAAALRSVNGHILTSHRFQGNFEGDESSPVKSFPDSCVIQPPVGDKTCSSPKERRNQTVAVPAPGQKSVPTPVSSFHLRLRDFN